MPIFNGDLLLSPWLGLRQARGGMDLHGNETPSGHSIPPQVHGEWGDRRGCAGQTWPHLPALCLPALGVGGGRSWDCSWPSPTSCLCCQGLSARQEGLQGPRLPTGDPLESSRSSHKWRAQAVAAFPVPREPFGSAGWVGRRRSWVQGREA